MQEFDTQNVFVDAHIHIKRVSISLLTKIMLLVILRVTINSVYRSVTVNKKTLMTIYELNERYSDESKVHFLFNYGKPERRCRT